MPGFVRAPVTKSKKVLSSGSSDTETQCLRSFGQALVVGDDPVELVADLQGRGQMQRIETAYHFGFEDGGPFAHCR